MADRRNTAVEGGATGDRKADDAELNGAGAPPQRQGETPVTTRTPTAEENSQGAKVYDRPEQRKFPWAAVLIIAALIILLLVWLL